jgi:uncharacterized protein (DUF1330 family)
MANGRRATPHLAQEDWMPKAYVVSRVTVTDPEAYAAYVKGATEAIRKHGGPPLARGGAQLALEGEARPRNVIIEFESLAQAERYYHSPEYQAAIRLREGAAVAEIVAVEGVD